MINQQPGIERASEAAESYESIRGAANHPPLDAATGRETRSTGNVVGA
jgi:hypothetical protein